MMETFATHRRALFGLAYRMLGSVADAEDAVQETYLRWHAQETAAITSPKAWLTATTTRLCIDRLRSAQRKREEYVGVWLPEPLITSDGGGADSAAAMADSLTMGFMLMLDTLPPVDRAVFLLREAFDYDYADIGRIVDKSEAACRQIVSRARRSFARTTPTAMPANRQAEQLVERFLTATRTGTLPELLALLSDDVVLYSDGGGRVAAAGRPIVSADRVARFFIGIRRFSPPGAGLSFTWVNGRPGAILRQDGTTDRVITVEFEGERIRAVYIVRNPAKLGHVAAN